MAIVLKSGSGDDQKTAARKTSAIAGFNLSDLADEGRMRLEQCRAQVRQMLEETERDVETIQKAADQRGYQEGLKRAAEDADRKLKAEAEQQAKASTQVMQQAVAKLHDTFADWMEQYSSVLTNIAISATEKIVQRRLIDEPELLVSWAGEAMHSTRSATRLTLVLHPETLAQIGPSIESLVASPGLPEETHIEADETLAKNEVVVRQNGGEVHAGLTAQLQRLQELLQ